MKILVHIKQKSDYFKGLLQSFGLDKSITENYDSITIEMTDDEIQGIRDPEQVPEGEDVKPAVLDQISSAKVLEKNEEDKLKEKEEVK